MGNGTIGILTHQMVGAAKCLVNILVVFMYSH